MEGSIWRKWDLHLHTPLTKLSNNFKIEDVNDNNDIWDRYCEEIEKSDIAMFGITDYFCCENYYIFLEKFKEKYPNSEKRFLLNIEFRLPTSVNKQGEEVNIHIIFDNNVSKSKIDEFLLNVKTTITDSSGASVKCKNLQNEHFKSASINLGEIKSNLVEVFGNSKPYLIVGAANNAGLRPTNSPRKMILTDEIDKDCDAFFGNTQNTEYYLKTNRYEDKTIISKPKPVFSGCDAHSFDDLEKKLGKKYINPTTQNVMSNNTWIKADSTFEGLKQVLFEPKYRILIQEHEPVCSSRKIEKIKFNFPSNIKIGRNGSTHNQDFCLKNLNKEIRFSRYFTCLVGGRGTGKSTIINLIGEKLEENTDFFKENHLQIDNKKYDIIKDELNLIDIIGTNDIEFISQGRIEKLAEGDKLTKLIFDERIKSLDSNFENLDNDILSIINTINSNIKNLEDIGLKTKILNTKKSDRETTQKIIDSVNDKEYKAISQNIALIKKEISTLQKSKNMYSELLKELKMLIRKFNKTDLMDEYSNRYNAIIDIITSIEEIQINDEVYILEKNFETHSARISELSSQFDEENNKLKSFLLQKGTSEDVIKDSQNANEKISRLNQEILLVEEEIKLLKEKYKNNEVFIDSFEEKSKEYEKLIGQSLYEINSRLDIKNENLLKISFEFFFDNHKFMDELFDEFYTYFNKYHISGTSKVQVKEALFTVTPKDVITYDYKTFIEEFNNKLSLNFNKNNNYIKILDEIFKSRVNIAIYKLIITKHLYNTSKYIQFRGFYGDKDLMSCSFGQRCTAVVVTLLMTGLKPLIIDEPEAHLDNKLIAEYLVELIKLKKTDRQIIFATHNSNFVINGDAELIHLLEIPHNDVYTNVTSTTIENVKYRDKLLRLEGGKEAFKIRENKYNL